jgi:hypothetical protein
MTSMRSLVVAVALALAPAVAAQSGPWTDLGFAFPGTHGLPHLECTGSLTPGSALQIDLTNAVEDEDAYLVLGFSTIYAPYKGGVLVPSFDVVLEFDSGPLGQVLIPAHWPVGVPSGFPIVLQYWIDDDAALAGRSGSNAMMGVVP